ncbi:uncharacterized protein LOC125548834 [Triticum urartu]|uniref:K Homology domain-containing protein n=1 Tax=Triticum urartu TaxID=4572 RepID=A0A8R7PX82_TRIUA|nr:uncharacterized protein LOC125548834 [Triticum urartu]
MAGEIHHGSPAAAIFPYVVVAKYLLSPVYQLVLLASAAKPEPSSLELLQPNTPVRSPDYDNDVQGTLTMGVADEYVGAVIGYAGRTIREIERVTGVQISISKGELKAGTSEREVVTSGTWEAVDAAEVMIVQRVLDAANSCRR